MKLEPKHIASYLPYGLRLKYVSTRMVDRLSNKDIIQLKEINEGYIYVNGYRTNNKSYIPILRPLSDFRDKIIRDIKIELDCSINQVTELFCLIDGSIRLQDITFGLYTVLCKNHVDFNKLIENNLAIDINTLNTIK